MALPTPAPTQELRALPMFDDLPAGCILHPIVDELTTPHLKPGEFAVVDTTDRRPDLGELFVIQWIGGRRDVVRAYHPRYAPESWNVKCLNSPSADGPFHSSHLEEKLLGCVVGVFVPAFDEASLRLI